MEQGRHTVGRYEVLGRIGRGGMATVYLACQSGLGRKVALKELAAVDPEDAPTFTERFLQESQIGGSLSHPNVVTVYDFFEHEGRPYIAMEYLQRGSLRTLIGRLTLAQIAGLIEGILAGLAHAHASGIVHRDLKPENLLVTAEGEIKIADFGVAKALNQAAGKYLTATGTTVGTPTYMAPEQAMGKNIGPWTDLYATGVVAYELLVGQVPFNGEDTPIAVLWKHVHEPIPSPRSARPDLDPRLADWLERMLAKAPTDRPDGALAAWEALEEIAVGIEGPLWRRSARLVELEDPEQAAKPLAPARFRNEVAAPIPSPPLEAAPIEHPPTASADAARTEPPVDRVGRREGTFVWPSERRLFGWRGLAVAAALATLALSGALAAVWLTGGDKAEAGGGESSTITVTTTTVATGDDQSGLRIAGARVERIGRDVQFVLSLRDGILPKRGLVTPDAYAYDGEARVELRVTKGVEEGVVAESGVGVSMRVLAFQKRLVVRFLAPAREFKALRARSSADGRSVALRLIAAPIPPTTRTEDPGTTTDVPPRTTRTCTDRIGRRYPC